MSIFQEFEAKVKTARETIESGIEQINKWRSEVKITPDLLSVIQTPKEIANFLTDNLLILNEFVPDYYYSIENVPDLERNIESFNSEISKIIDDILYNFSDTVHTEKRPYGAMYRLKRVLEGMRKEIIRLHGCINKSQPPEKAGQGETDIPDYRVLDLAKRTVAIGTTTYPITREKDWDFLKDLCTAFRDDRIVPMLEGATNNKNAVDHLRRLIGNGNLHKLIIFVKGGYKLNPEIKILNRGQIGIRKTRLSRNQK